MKGLISFGCDFREFISLGRWCYVVLCVVSFHLMLSSWRLFGVNPVYPASQGYSCRSYMNSEDSAFFSGMMTFQTMYVFLRFRLYQEQ